MAKAKAKTPHARLVQAFKKAQVGTWSRNAADLVDRIDRAREGGSLEQVCGCPLLASTPLTLQETFLYGNVYAELYGDKASVPRYPAIMAMWERDPKYLELSLDAVYEFEFSEAKATEGPLSALEAFFPGCLLIDTSGIEWECDYFDVLVSAVFLYPTYHEGEGLPMLRCVAMGDDKARTCWFSDLYLVGDTLHEARLRTDSIARRQLAVQLTDSAEREAYEELRDYFEAFDYTQANLNALMDRLLGLMLVGVLVPEELGFDGNVRLIRLVSRREAEEKAVRQERAEAFLANEARALDGACNTDGFTGAEGDVKVGETSDNGSAPSVREPVPPDDTQLLKEALVQAGERYEQMKSRADADKAAFLHHVHELEARCRKLEERSAALAKRAALIDELEVPRTPLDALRLAQRAYPDRLLFLDQAVESASEFDGRTAGEVWALLRSMATVLHPLIFGEEKGDVAEIYQSRSGFELALRDVKQLKRNPKLMKKRTMSFEGSQYDMSAHVKGRSNKPGEALRVHFFADRDRQLLVIGHCGDHLPA